MNGTKGSARMIESLIGGAVSVVARRTSALGLPEDALQTVHEMLAPARRQLSLNRVRELSQTMSGNSPGADPPPAGDDLEADGILDFVGDIAEHVFDAVGGLLDWL
jgi:hypothetical protein